MPQSPYISVGSAEIALHQSEREKTPQEIAANKIFLNKTDKTGKDLYRPAVRHDYPALSYLKKTVLFLL